MIPPEKLTEVERKCREAIAAREAEGVRVLPVPCVSGLDGEMCVLGAIIGPSEHEGNYVRRASDIIQVDLCEAQEIENGFMDWRTGAWCGQECPEFYSLGQTLRAEQLRKHGGAQ